MVSLNQVVERLKASRRHFLKHVQGVTDEQSNWKPYPNCLSINETLRHLRVDDLAAMDSMETGEEPKYEEIQQRVQADSGSLGMEDLLKLLAESHDLLVKYIETKYENQSLDAEICVWGNRMPLVLGVPYLSGEDYYHAGQVAFIRQATDPSWNYYGEIYG